MCVSILLGKIQHNRSILLRKMHPWRYAQSPKGRISLGDMAELVDAADLKIQY